MRRFNGFAAPGRSPQCRAASRHATRWEAQPDRLHGGRDSFLGPRSPRSVPQSVIERRLVAAGPSCCVNARKMSDASQVLRCLLPAVHRRCDRRRVVVAPIASELILPHRHGVPEPHHVSELARRNRYHIVVGFGNRAAAG